MSLTYAVSCRITEAYQICGAKCGAEMAQITDVMLKRQQAGGKPLSDPSVSGLRFEPGATSGEGKWILRYVSPVTGKRRDMGLGSYPDTGIKNARGRALEARRQIDEGRDPIDVRNKQRAAVRVYAEEMTFEAAARKVHAELKPGWKNAKHAAQWLNTLEAFAFPKIGKKKVGELSPSDFADVLRPIWLEKAETASRVKQRCHGVIKWCWAQGFVKSNPVDVVDHLLPKQPGKRERVQHQPSMPWRIVPAFVQDVLWAGPRNVTRSLLEFVALTAPRSGEARGMTWDEIDLEEKMWTVPAARMKAKVIHRVPLSERALQILREQRLKHPEAQLVFPAPRGGVLSDMALTAFLRDQNAPSTEKGRIATVHGFRSSFRDWASENDYSRDLADRALAHTIKNQAEAAYHRTDLLEQRRVMMEAWAQHVCGVALGREVFENR